MASLQSENTSNLISKEKILNWFALPQHHIFNQLNQL